jgi:TonB family protein
MRIRRFLIRALALAVFCHHGSAQDVLPVDVQTLDQHVAHRVAPAYPPDAKAAKIEGTVVLEIEVGTSGKVESTNVVSGPKMLQQAAIDCVKQWTYVPFVEDGSPVEATGPVFLEFGLGKDAVPADKTDSDADKERPASKTPAKKQKLAPIEEPKEKTAERFSAAAEECKKDLAAGTDYKAAFIACKKAAEVAEEFPPDRRFVEKRSAFVSAAWASMYGGFMKAALTYASKAVDVVKLGHDDDAGGNAAYGVKGVIEGKLGELPAADQDLTQAEDYARKEMASAEKDAPDAPDAIDAYKQPFALELRFHAQVLQALDRQDDAQKKLDEAAKYD